jgi:hypothetical protein
MYTTEHNMAEEESQHKHTQGDCGKAQQELKQWRRKILMHSTNECTTTRQIYVREFVKAVLWVRNNAGLASTPAA